jgi:probable phosphoglycerate mutase
MERAGSPAGTARLPADADGDRSGPGPRGRVAGEGVDAIFASPLGRARTTARIIADELGLDVVVIDDLAEVHHGHFAGLSNQDIELRYPGALARRAADKYRWRFPGGESYADADVRAGRALATARGYPARRPALVAHAMIGRLLQRHLLGLAPEEALALRQPNDVIIVVDPRTRARWELRAQP